MTRTGLAVTNNTKFITTINKWRTEAESIKLDVDTETEGVQMDLMLAREFLNVQTLTESRAKELKTYENHSKSMSTTWKKVNNIKLKDFMKTYILSEDAKGYVKEEFRRFTNHILLVQKTVNAEMAKILKELQEAQAKEPKPTPAVQPSGSVTCVYKMEYNPMNNYSKSDWNEYGLTMKSTWIQYIDRKRRLDNHFNHV